MGMKKIVAAVLGGVAALASSGMGLKPQESPDDRRPAYVDAVKAPATVKAGQKLDVALECSMPDPSWEPADVQIERDKPGHVRITPWIRRKHKDMTMQVIVPFERTVPVEGLTPGKWTIEVRGHGDTAGRVDVEVLP